MNKLGKERIPFLFILDFDLKDPIILPFHEIDQEQILFDFSGTKNFSVEPELVSEIKLVRHPVTFDEYIKAFTIVMKNLRYGNSFLTNLTFPTKITLNCSLKEVFFFSNARYRLWYQDLFTVFSPEIFVKIINGKIFSHPMKGTIDARIPDAARIILEDSKELAEHHTIVDLIRNDLSMVARNVKVDRFRYLEKLSLFEKELLQVSSLISGELPKDYSQRIGDIIISLLPAGSISGAPKKKTVEIIHRAEPCKRGYYTGITGCFDGGDLDSGVMIRYIEKAGTEYYFKSGGGITVNSDPEKEYQELIDKVNVPVV